MWPKCAGKIAKDSISEKTRTIMVTKGIILQICPMLPATDNIGEKAAMVVKIANITGTDT